MTDEPPKYDLHEDAEPMPPTRRRVWLRVLLSAFVVFFFIVVLSARPGYEWWMKHRAAKLRTEAAHLAGSQNIADWKRLVLLARIPLAVTFPFPVSTLFIASENKVAALEVSVHAAAATALHETVLKDKANVARALTSGFSEVAEWVWTNLAPRAWGGAEQDEGISYATVLYWLWQGCGRTVVEDFLVSGTISAPLAMMPGLHPTGKMREWQLMQIRLGTLRYMTNAEPLNAYPIVKGFLHHLPETVRQQQASEVSFLEQWCRGYEQRYRFATAWLPYDLLTRNPKWTPLLSLGLRGIFATGRPLGGGLLRCALHSHDPDFRLFVVCEAFNGRLLRPHDLWIGLLQDPDDRIQFIAARVLGHDRATEAADALAALGRKGTPVTSDIELQAAWSLVTMGDPRGRKTLESWKSRRVKLPLGEWPRFFAFRSFTRADGRSPRPAPANTPTPRNGGEIAASILSYVDHGGTIPLSITPWPKPGQISLIGQPAILGW